SFRFSDFLPLRTAGSCFVSVMGLPTKQPCRISKVRLSRKRPKRLMAAGSNARQHFFDYLVETADEFSDFLQRYFGVGGHEAIVSNVNHSLRSLFSSKIICAALRSEAVRQHVL
ncbi:MAG: hypothetical protein JXR40_02055, partial [Pontiellaceae bacterium]|nr:hypothetical protein [Pontiellaceae bacterium]